MVALVAGVLHHSARVVSGVMLVVGLAAIAVVFLAGPLLRRVKTSTIYLAGALIVVATLVILSISQEMYFVWPASLLLGLGLGLLNLANSWQVGAGFVKKHSTAAKEVML